jgi:SAM-dependent methyltransferase
MQYGAVARERGSPAQIVQCGYDVIAPIWSQWSANNVLPPLREKHVELVLDRLPANARVVELGCGPGTPVGEMLANRSHYIGVDLSRGMLRLAQQNVPSGAFVQANMSQLEFASESVDGVFAFASLIHVPREKHVHVLSRVARWLKPGGIFVAALGAGDNPMELNPDWLGVPMYWSHFDAPRNLWLLGQAGLDVEGSDVIEQHENGVAVRFLWVMAIRP